MIIRVFVTTTHRDSGQCERLAGNWYVVDEAIARELAAARAVSPDFQSLDDNQDAVDALVDELFAAPPVVDEGAVAALFEPQEELP